MKNLTKFIGFTAILCMVNPSFAALRAGGTERATTPTGRVSVAVSPTTAAARRLPTMKYVGATTTTTSTTTTSTNSSLMTERECVDAYSECIRAADVCGPDFEECTTNELFYAQKPKCNSVLLQCASTGINTLFGTSSITNLSADYMDVYPTAGSIIGQYIEAGAINNRLDTSSCVKRYMSCVKKDNVCGENFELCTSNDEFKKQKIYCESTLARCQDEGKTELFGRTDTSQNPTAESRLGVAIKEGEGLAMVNAVSTCYKVANQCLLSACTANPYKCIVNSSMDLVNTVDRLSQTNQVSGESTTANSDVINASAVSRYLRGACMDTIGGNKYCHMAANEGKTPTAKDLIDEYVRDEVYSDIYDSVMNTTLRQEIQKLADDIDYRTKMACSDTIKSCAMRTCGSGLGSACYSKVFGGTTKCFDKYGQTAAGDANNATCSINGNSTYDEIKIGCESIVDTDANCRYAAAAVNKDLYTYEFSNSDAFARLFPKKSTNKDPIGVVGRLNSALQENYNAAAIEKMAKQCKNTAVSCIRSLCGSDFVNCYRSRTDVMTDTYATATNGLGTPYTEETYSSAGGSMSGGQTSTTTYDSSAFDASMNKVGGVLDFTIVRGLCINTVKEASACEEHLKIQAIKNNTDDGPEGWGANTVRDAWVDAVSGGYSAKVLRDEQAILIGCRTSTKGCDQEVVAECDTVDSNGCVYDQEEYQAQNEYQLNMAANTLFREVMGDLELEAQAKYNAKLNKEQRMCVDANNGGIMGRKDISSVYQWVKLRNNRVPKNYSVNGLKSNEFIASNDLYGSFCRARVTVQSDDPDIQAWLQNKNNTKNWTTAYFAVGDVFTCGSWIPQSDLERMSTLVACKKGKANGSIDASFDCSNIETADDLQLTQGQKWGVAGLSILGAIGGGTITDVLQTNTGLGGLLNTNATKVDDCKTKVSTEEIYWTSGDGATAASQCAGKDDHEFIGYTMTASNSTVIRKNSNSKSIVGRKLISSCSDTNNSHNTHCNQAVKFGDGNNNTVKLDSIGTNGHVSCKTINDHVKNIKDYCGETSGWARAGIDLLGAGVVGTASGIASAQVMKANNRAKFTEAQQQFMNNVGNHIYCFIGADEAGTYGDLIEISVE